MRSLNSVRLMGKIVGAPRFDVRAPEFREVRETFSSAIEAAKEVPIWSAMLMMQDGVKSSPIGTAVIEVRFYFRNACLLHAAGLQSSDWLHVEGRLATPRWRDKITGHWQTRAFVAGRRFDQLWTPTPAQRGKVLVNVDKYRRMKAAEDSLGDDWAIPPKILAEMGYELPEDLAE